MKAMIEGKGGMLDEQKLIKTLQGVADKIGKEKTVEAVKKLIERENK